MKADRKLNLVIPVDTDAGTLWVHSMPISRQVFERYFLVIGKAFEAIHTEGLGRVAGPRVAMMMLRKAAEGMGPEVSTDVENGLIQEIKRLTNVLVPAKTGGWETVPVQEAINRKTIDEDDAAEVENALAFFTLASAMYPKDQLAIVLNGLVKLWGAQTSPSNVTEFSRSLPTSTPDENSGAKAIVSSIPS